MSYNFVEVTINLTDPTGEPLDQADAFQAGLLCMVSDLVWDTQAGTVVAVPPIRLNTVTDTSPTQTVMLLAMDNQSLSDNWCWLVTPSIHGGSLPSRKLNVAYSNGASQNLATLLSTSTLL